MTTKYTKLEPTECTCPVCDEEIAQYLQAMNIVTMITEPVKHHRLKNNNYLVEVHTEDDGTPVYAKIWKNNHQHLRNWQDLQRIKNDVGGPHSEAIEIFPDEDKLMDTENCYWLWFAPPGKHFPFGIDYPRRELEDPNSQVQSMNQFKQKYGKD